MRITDILPTEQELRDLKAQMAAIPSLAFVALARLGLLSDAPGQEKDTPMAQDERHNTRTPVEFIAHLLEVGEWHPSAIELDQYRPNFANGEQLREEAERIVRRSNREALLNRGEAMTEDR